MSFRTDRRRLLLADELLHTSSEDLPSACEPLPAVSRGRYAAAAERDNQPRMIDFVPLRPWSMSLTIVLGAAIIAMLLSAHAWLGKLSGYLTAEALVPFNLATDRSLANWFASLLLLVNMQLALVIYSLRKHRVDDYHGRYRLWLWIALASLVASLELATDIGQLFKAAVNPVSRLCGVAETIGLLTVVGLLACYLTVRAILETRRSPATVVTLMLSGSLLAASAAMGYPMFSLRNMGTAETAILVRSGMHLTGCLLLLIASMFYSRHVMLDVEGKLPLPKPRQPKPARIKPPRARKVKTDLDAPEPSREEVKKRIVDPPQKPRPHLAARAPEAQPASRGVLAAKAAAVTARAQTSNRPERDADSDDDDAEANTGDLRNLSRAERKRLKREAKLARR